MIGGSFQKKLPGMGFWECLIGLTKQATRKTHSIIDGRDLQLENLLKANRKVSVDKSVTISKWIALVLTQVKRQMHALGSPTGSSH